MAKEKTRQTRIAIGYPPIETDKGTALLSQNRQFQYFNKPTYIYPMVPAYAASNLQKHGYKVFWMDGIAEKQTYKEWLADLKKNNVEFLLMESKSPVIKSHWKIIADIKKNIPDLTVILIGDHVTAFPIESMEKSNVDVIITGGDYDFLIVNLLNHITKGEKLEGGFYWRAATKGIKGKPLKTEKLKSGQTVNSTGAAMLRHNINELPFVDRDLTRWELYAYENGNYKYTPATYMYSGRDCWWNRCTFCVWDHTLNPVGSYRSFTPERLFEEVKHVVDKYKVKEIFDDAGTMFIGPKLTKFCELLIESGYNKKVVYSCNMRFNALKLKDYQLMKKANFRFILFGLESANQKTLDKLDKGVKTEEIVEGAKAASQAGLEPHATVMLGYPWESYEDAKKTIHFAKDLFKKGYLNTMQATIVIPYPATPLWKEAKEKGWLTTEDYDEYDMRRPVMKVPFEEKKLLELTQELYSAFLTPRFILRKITEIRNLDDIKFFWMAGLRLLAHLLDFDPSQEKTSIFSPKFLTNVIKKWTKRKEN